MKKLKLPVLAILLVLTIIGVTTTVVLLNSRAATSNSKLGIFAHTGSGGKIAEACPKVIKYLAFPPDQALGLVNFAKAYKGRCPGGTTLLRFYFDENGQSDLGPHLDADNSALEVFEQYEPVLKTLKQNGNLQYFDYIAGPTNETERMPLWTETHDKGWMARFWETLSKHNASAGIKTCVGNILTGDLPLDPNSIEAIKIVLMPEMKRNGSVFCYHGYSDNGFSKDAGVQEEHPLRYRPFYRALGADAPKMVIGELGIAGGWQTKGTPQQYESWLEWFDGEIKKDGQIIGATIYEIGGSGKDGIEGHVEDWLTNYLKANGGGNTGTPTPGGGGGCGGPNPVCEENCRVNIRPGNCTYCRAYCQGQITLTPTPTPSPSGSPTPQSQACQGNPNASAKCFDCKKDSPLDQLNILDFACFAKYYGQNVGT